MAGLPTAPPGDNEWAQGSQFEGVPPRYLYIHTGLPNSQLLNFDAYAKDSKRVEDFIWDLLTEEEASTG